MYTYRQTDIQTNRQTQTDGQTEIFLLLGDHMGKENFLFLNINTLFRGDLMNRLKFIMQQQWQDTINLFTRGNTNQVVNLVFAFC